jgi:hypothetical protein
MTIACVEGFVAPTSSFEGRPLIRRSPMLRNELLHKPFGYLFKYAELALDVLEISNRSLEQLNVFEIRCQKASFVYRYIWQHSKPILVFIRASVSFVYNSPDSVFRIYVIF